MASTTTAVAPASGPSADLTPIEFNGQRVITLAMMDRAHQRPEGTAGRNFRQHRAKLAQSSDFFDLTADEIRRQSLASVFPPRTSSGIILTESGYLLLVKSFTDDLAWQVQRELVNGYFRSGRPATQPAPPNLDDPRVIRAMLLGYTEKVIALEEQVAEQAPKVAALDRITASTENLTLTETAKVLGVKRAAMTQRMHAEGWIYRQNKSWVAYEKQIKSGRLTYKEAAYTDENTGSECYRAYCHVTPKGMTDLAQMFAGVAA